MKQLIFLLIKKNKGLKWLWKKNSPHLFEMGLNLKKNKFEGRGEDSIGFFGLEFFQKLSESFNIKKFSLKTNFRETLKSSIFISWKIRNSGKTLTPNSILIFVKGIPYFFKKKRFRNSLNKKTIFSLNEKIVLYSKIKTESKKKNVPMVFSEKEAKTFDFFSLIQQKI